MTARPRLLAAAAFLTALALAFGRGAPEPQDPCEAHPQTYPCALFASAPTAAAPLPSPAQAEGGPAADGTS